VGTLTNLIWVIIGPPSRVGLPFLRSVPRRQQVHTIL
jgi:hypothetical protein